MYTKTFRITNMTCMACAKLSKMALDKIPDITESEVDFDSGLAKISAQREISWEEIVAALAEFDKKAENL